jgi:hypothetical protein
VFYLNLKNRDNTFFTTLLYKINRILYKKHVEENLEILVLEPEDKQPKETKL